MEPDDALPRPGPDTDATLDALVREDIDRLSIAELEGRITALEGEIARCRRRIAYAVDHRASADQLFKP